jgi:ABC-2 type transport system ATP-binding protein
MIEIKDLMYGYSKNQQLLNIPALELRPGSVYGLLGKNGAGKSTLLNLMSGLLSPKNGTVKYDGLAVFDRTVKTLSETFLVPEEFDAPNLSGAQFIDQYAPFYTRFDLNRFNENLAGFNLSLPKNLKKQSMGERKKFLMAFALATGCALILMDEPTNGLDIPAKSAFRKIMASSMSEKSTFVISTHQVRDLEQIIDHVLILDNQKIQFDHSIFTIQDQLGLKQANQSYTGTSFYSESALGNSVHLVPKNQANSESENIDFEFLFNAVMANAPLINTYLNKQ